MKRILVVEDRQSIREFVVETLKDVGGFDVDGAEDGAAINLLDDNDYDLFIVDLYLTSSDLNPDGLDLIRKIREKKPGSKFIIMSGKSLSEHIEESVFELGITNFLAKPITVKELVRTVRKSLE